MGFADTEARVTLDLAPEDSVFGLGETTGQFNRHGVVRDFWNIDVLGHAPAIHAGLRQLYVSIPFATVVRAGRTFGVFWDNPARQYWDVGQTRRGSWQMSAASGEIDLHVFLGPTPSRVAARYAELTGRMPMPPAWALGYQQCRYSYETATRVLQIAREFRRRHLPCDVLYLDIHHMDRYRVFTFGRGFPKPRALMARLSRMGFKVVAIVDPGVKDDPQFGVLRRGLARNAFVKDSGGTQDFVGEVWPGKSRFPDFLNPDAREWWGTEQRTLHAAGVAGIWNDMNEPANFARPDKTLAPEAVHRPPQGPRPHVEVHNVYGMEMARASRDAALRHATRLPRTGGLEDSAVPRPLVITRAGYAGIQRHAIVWTGDNSSNWDQLNDAVQMLLNLSVSGVPFCGGDVGGFMDNATEELFVRWFQFAAFTPFFRNHSNLGTVDQEPWAFGGGAERICRDILKLRYRLVPLLYSLFAEAHRSGAPIIRPLFWHFPEDPVAVACGDQFLLGAGLMVAPILRQGAVARSVYLPAGTWFDFATGHGLHGGRHVLVDAPIDRIPLFVRAGAILPMCRAAEFIRRAVPRTPELHVWDSAAGEFKWYEDDGKSQAYEGGAQSSRRIAFNPTSGTLEFGEPVGNWTSAVRRWAIIFHRGGGAGSGESPRIERWTVANRPGTFQVALRRPTSNPPAPRPSRWRTSHR